MWYNSVGTPATSISTMNVFMYFYLFYYYIFYNYKAVLIALLFWFVGSGYCGRLSPQEWKRISNHLIANLRKDLSYLGLITNVHGRWWPLIVRWTVCLFATCILFNESKRYRLKFPDYCSGRASVQFAHFSRTKCWISSKTVKIPTIYVLCVVSTKNLSDLYKA